MPVSSADDENDKKKVVLTEEQKAFIDANWDKMKLVQLVKETFKDPKLDGRSFEGKAVKDYLLSSDREPTPTAYQKMPQIELSEQHQEFVRNNAKFMSSVEMARTLFNNRTLTPLHLETRAVNAFIRTLPAELSGKSFEDEVNEEYTPPKTIKQIVDKVNEYVFTGYNHEGLNAQQKRSFEILIGFLRSPRFLQMINSYTSKMSRKIFEGEYVRTVYDKPDLTPDELNLCINLCWNYVQMITVNRHLDMLNERYEVIVTDPDSKMATSLADMIAAKTKELNDCDQRQQKLINDLNGKRSERHKNRSSNNLSVANLVEMWKDEEERKRLIRMVEKKKEAIVEEVDRIESMDDFKARLMGFTKSELTNG